MKKITLVFAFLFILFGIHLHAQNRNLEIGAGSRSTIEQGPVKTATFQFQQNISPPGASNITDYTTHPLAVTFSWENLQIAETEPYPFVAIGYSAAPIAISRRFGVGTSAPVPVNSSYTYAGGITPAVTGTGLEVTTATPFNYGAHTSIRSRYFELAGIPTDGTLYYMADFKITFNRPVNNPVIHFAGLGFGGAGFAGSPTYEIKSFSATSPSISLSKLSGTAPMGVSSTMIFPTVIDNNNQMDGSVLVSGKGITEIIFKVSYSGIGGQWSDTDSVLEGDFFSISASLAESNLSVTKSADNLTPAIGSNVTFTIGASNAGISNSPQTQVTDLLPSGYEYVSHTAPSGTTYDPATGIWNIGTLNSGASAGNLTIVAKVKSTGVYKNIATISGYNTDPVLADNVAEVTLVPNTACPVVMANLTPYNNGSAKSETVFLNNDIRIGTNRLHLTNLTTLSPASLFTPNMITDTHYNGEVGIQIGHNNNVASGISYANRINTTLSFDTPMNKLSFTVSDLDLGDNVVVNAFDENNNPINLTAANFHIYYPTNVSRVGNRFYPPAAGFQAPNNTREGSVDFDFNGLSISKVVFEFYDTSYLGSYSISKISGEACPVPVIDAVNDTYTNVAPGSSTTSVINNDTLNNASTSIGTTTGTVSIRTATNASGAAGAWPTGFTLNTSTGAINVGAGVTPGTYTLYYTICAQTAGTVCDTATVTITIAVPLCTISATNPDSDGDGIANDCDLDDDNDGILDTDEGYCEQSVYTMNMTQTLASANSTFNVNGSTFNLVYTLTSGAPVAGLGNSFNVPYTYSDFNNQVSAVDHRWEGFSVGSALGNGILRLAPNVTPFYNSLPANNRQTEYVTAAIVPNTPDGIYRYLLNNNSLTRLGTYSTTIGNLPNPTSVFSKFSSHTDLNQYSQFNTRAEATYITNGYYSKMQLQNNINPEQPANTLRYASNYGQSYVWDYTAFNDGNQPLATNSGGRGLITIQENSITYCTKRDTDGDGIPDYLDLDSDNDGCPDAIEGSGNFTTLVNSTMPGGNTGATSGTYNQPITQNLGNVVNTDPTSTTTYGVPTVAGNGQAAGTSNVANAIVNAGTASANQTIPSGTAPAALSLTGQVGTIQWQVSTDNSTFTNIAGATSATYSPGVLTATRYYRAILTSVGGCTATSNVVTITVESACYEDPTLAAGTFPVKHGITVLGRAGKDNGDWPNLRNSAYTALEGKTKGFVITRNADPEGTISAPVVGMMVFDTDAGATGCLKIYTGPAPSEGWKCFTNQTCP